MANFRGTKSAKPARNRSGILLGLFLGLLLGLLCAFGVVWYLNKTPLPFLDKSSHTEKTEAKPAAEQPHQPPQQLPGKPGDKAINGTAEKPRFEFYKILPGGQEASMRLGNTKPDATTPAPSPAAEQAMEIPPATSMDSFYLQAGAFQKSVDADNLKAKLALMGLETSVLEVKVPDKGVMFRVRVGPYAKPEEMNRVRTLLAQNGIQATVVKVKDSGANPAPASTGNAGNR